MDTTEKRRSRVCLSPKQHQILTEQFGRCAFPDAKVRTRLSNILNMSPRSVQIWFQNRRQKAKIAGECVSEMHSPSCGHKIPAIKSLEQLSRAACLEYMRRHWGGGGEPPGAVM